MYLLAIVTLVIGMLGVYAQVLSLQAAQFAGRQTGLAMAMMQWHTAAISMAASIYDTNQFPVGSFPCSLTSTLPTGLGACPPPDPVAIGGTWAGAPAAPALGTVTTIAPYTLNYIYNTKALPLPGAAELVHLSSSFDITAHQFYSMLYLDASNQPYIVTFVQPPTVSSTNPAPGLLSLPPTGALTSFSMADLAHQLHVSSLPPYTYGTVKTIAGVQTLVTNEFQYALPGTTIKSGAIAIIGSSLGF